MWCDGVGSAVWWWHLHVCTFCVCVSGGGVVTHVWCDGVSFVV